jgi:hypothetical protein
VAGVDAWFDTLEVVTSTVLANNTPGLVLDRWGLSLKGNWAQHRAALCQDLRPWRQDYTVAESKLQSARQLCKDCEEALKTATAQRDTAAKELESAEQRVGQLTLSATGTTHSSGSAVAALPERPKLGRDPIIDSNQPCKHSRCQGPNHHRT